VQWDGKDPGADDALDLLPKIMRLFHSRHLASAKMLIRSIVERLVKVLPEEVEEVFPQAHMPLLQHVQKQLARQQRPKTVRESKVEEEDEQEEEEDQKGRRRGKKKEEQSWESFKAGDEAEADDDEDMADTGKASKKRARGREDEGGQKIREPPTSAVMAHDAVQALLDAWEEEDDDEDGSKKGARSKRKRNEVAASTWIQEDQDVPIDFMSADAAHSVLTVRAPPSKRRRGVEVGGAGAENKVDMLRRSGLRFSEDGRLVVDEAVEPEKDEDSKTGKFNIGAESQKPKALSQLAAQRARRAQAKAKARIARKGSHIIKGLDTYKPGKKKAQGDAKRKGSKLEPFAYVRLNPKVTKEKYKSKATESFSKVIKGAKKGVVKGMKARAKDLKQKQAKEARKRKQARNAQKSHKPGSR